MTMAVSMDGGVRPPARFGKAFSLAAPIVIFLFIPNAVSLVTLALIGKLGNAALAGIGIANVVYGMLLALLFGFDTGVQAVVSRATGAGTRTVAGQALTDAIGGSAPLGSLLGVAVFFFGPVLVHALSPDPFVTAAGAAFLHGAAISMLFLAVTIPFNAYWIGSGTPNVSFFVTLALAPVQIAATFALVLGYGAVPALGTLGAGVALSVTTFCGLLLQLFIARRVKRVPFGPRPRLAGLAMIVKIGWPVSLQQSFAQVGLVLAFAVVSQLGVTATAVLNVLASLMMIPIQSATGLGTAAATLVGQALGRHDARDAARWGWQMGFAAALLLLPLGLLAVTAPRLLLGLFLHDAASVMYAMLPVQILGASVAIDAFARVMNFALRGAGATGAATAIPFVTLWLMQLPLMWLVGIRLQHGMTGVVTVQAAIIAVEAAAFVWVWRRGRWAAVRIAGVAS